MDRQKGKMKQVNISGVFMIEDDDDLNTDDVEESLRSTIVNETADLVIDGTVSVTVKVDV